MSDRLNLHLGCGFKRHLDYINIDVQYNPVVDVVADIRFLKQYQLNSVHKIYACHVLEHFGRWEYMQILRRWYDLLQDGGRLRISVPNFAAITTQYLVTGKIELLTGLLYGGQDDPYNYHKWIWDFKSMSNDLAQIGFRDINMYDWKDDDFKDMDDFSKAYIPHMDVENGMLMSLNVEAFK